MKHLYAGGWTGPPVFSSTVLHQTAATMSSATLGENVSYLPRQLPGNRNHNDGSSLNLGLSTGDDGQVAARYEA
jgi:hypothetical protein